MQVQMLKMGRIMSVAALVLATGVGGFAQAPRFGRGIRGMQPVQLADVPVSILGPALNLKDEVKAKVADIEIQLKNDIRAARPVPAVTAPGETPAPPDPAARRAEMQQIRNLTQASSDKIMALLDDTQKTAAAALLKDLQSISFAGVPVAALNDLKLSDGPEGQRAKIIAIGAQGQADLQAKIKAATESGDRSGLRADFTQIRDDMHTKVLALLNDDQKKILANYTPRGGRRAAPGAAAPAAPVAPPAPAAPAAQ